MRGPSSQLPGVSLPPQPPRWLATLQRAALATLPPDAPVASVAVHTVAHALLSLPDELMSQFEIPPVEMAALDEAGGLAVLAKRLLEAKLEAVDLVIAALYAEQQKTAS